MSKFENMTINTISNRGTQGPFEVRDELSEMSPADGSVLPVDQGPSSTTELPARRYECIHYEGCLGLAASLNWESFTCEGCSGSPSEHLVWRARTTARKDSIAARLLQAVPLAPVHTIESPRETESPVDSFIKEP